MRLMLFPVAVVWLLAACQPAAPSPAGTAADQAGTSVVTAGTAPAGTSGPAGTDLADADRTPEVSRLLAAAREKGETELAISWGQTSLGGPDGAKRFESLFNQVYGTSIRIHFTPGPSRNVMAAKIAQELAAGQKASSDLILGNEDLFSDLLNREVLEEYDYTLLSRRITRELVALRNIGVEIYSNVPAIIYNTELVRAEDVPRTLEDTLAPKWRGRIATSERAAYFDRIAMRPEWTPERMKAFVTRLSQHVGGLIRLGEDSRILTGEFAMMVIGNTDNVRAPKSKGAPIDFAIPEDAATVGFTHLGVPRNAPHPNLSKLFINMILSSAGQRAVWDVDSADHLALPGSHSAEELAGLKARGASIFEVDVAWVAAHPEFRELSDELARIVREKPGG
jgi:ABC-type Fe3+ transport system substrate-binding protein